MRAHIDAQLDEQREELLKAKLSEPHPEEGVITESEYGDRQRAAAIRSVEREAKTKATPAPVTKDARAHQFAQFWNVVPHKIKRAKAEAAFRKAVIRVATDSGMDQVSAAAFICERMSLYAKSPAANPTDRSPTHPATWLNGGQFEDDPGTWNMENGVPAQRKLEL
jgi:hypothetical protein